MKRFRGERDDFLRVEAHDCPMSSCAAPAGSPCRTGKGLVAVQYHTARFRPVPHLARTLSVPAPAVRKPGSVWIELPRPAAAGTGPAGHVRIGYARASTVRQSLDTQMDSLKAASVTRIFSEKISTRAVSRPELDRAVALARELRAPGPRPPWSSTSTSGSARLPVMPLTELLIEIDAETNFTAQLTHASGATPRLPKPGAPPQPLRRPARSGVQLRHRPDRRAHRHPG